MFAPFSVLDRVSIHFYPQLTMNLGYFTWQLDVAKESASIWISSGRAQKTVEQMTDGQTQPAAISLSKEKSRLTFGPTLYHSITRICVGCYELFLNAAVDEIYYTTN